MGLRSFLLIFRIGINFPNCNLISCLKADVVLPSSYSEGQLANLVAFVQERGGHCSNPKSYFGAAFRMAIFLELVDHYLVTIQNFAMAYFSVAIYVNT